MHRDRGIAPDRGTLKKLLSLWREGQLSPREVRDRAEEMWASNEWGVFSETDDRSIPVEVLAQLDAMNLQWITADDVPALLNFLNTPPGHASEGWKWWRRYWDTIDFPARRRLLAGEPFYST
jgi:hypothetical protein